MWKELVRKYADLPELPPPCSVDQIAEAEEKLGVGIPDDLRNLLLEADGVADEYGSMAVWPIQQIVDENLNFRRFPDFRELYMPFDHLLFFGDHGNGNQFAFAIQADGAIHRPDVFVWDHENDSRSWVASSLANYLNRSLSGQFET